MMRYLSRLFVAGALMALASAASAQTANVQVQANVGSACRIQTPPPVTKTATYDVFAASVTDSFAMGVRCTKGVSFQIAVSGGNNAAQVAGFNRAVRLGATTEYIGYSIAYGASGDLAAGGNTGSIASNGRNADRSVQFDLTYDVSAAADPAVGLYVDDLVFTMTAL